ncbi:MAG: hypothetical protein Q8S00_31795 [Deltaproteobacteria bacterium]|nr:hypothetical protein [Deltaproteobacteria bacterium]
MQDTALYQYLLGLKSPWTVSRVDLNVKGQCGEVWAKREWFSATETTADLSKRLGLPNFDFFS